MGKQYQTLDGFLRNFIEKQHLFFVATAPLGNSGHLNLSPKGLDTFRVLGSSQVAYLDHVGSGAETVAHLRENGRIIIMFCAFEGSPRIVRLHGLGHAVEPPDRTWTDLRQHFPVGPEGRAIICIDVQRMSDSCGFGIPKYQFVKHRPQLPAWSYKKGDAGLRLYQHTNNSQSIDGLPALRWLANQPARE